MEQVKGRLYLLGAFTLAGTSVISARLLAGRAGTFTITAVSLFFAVLLLLPMSGRRLWKNARRMPLRQWLMSVFQALFGILLFRMFLLLGLKHTSAGETGVLTGATPAITALLACVFLKERIRKRGLAGIFCTVSGIFMLNGLLTTGAGFVPGHLPGNLLVLCAAACESAFNILSKAASLHWYSGDAPPMHPLIQTALVCVVAFFLCIPPAALEDPVHTLSKLDFTGWLALAWYGLFVTALAFIFWYAGIQRCTAHTAAAFSGMMPFVSLVLSAMFLDESMGFCQWCGGMLIIAGMVLIGRSQAMAEKGSKGTLHICFRIWGKLRKKHGEEKPMQTVWKGAVSFGLLNVPVKMGAATHRENVAFRQLHKACNTPISQKRFCGKCGVEVPYEDIVRGYEYEPGKFVIITGDDLEAIPIKTARYIDIMDFIRLGEVDPIYFDKTYYLWPEKGGEKPYLILRNAMRESGRAAVAKVTMREKEHLCLVRLVGDTLAVATMFFPDEIRSSAELNIGSLEGSVPIREEEMEMAIKLIDNLTAPFDPAKYRDRYREELMKVIRAKVEGKQVVEAEPAPAPAGNVVDLMERLRQSVEATAKKEEKKPAGRKKKAGQA